MQHQKRDAGRHSSGSSVMWLVAMVIVLQGGATVFVLGMWHERQNVVPATVEAPGGVRKVLVEQLPVAEERIPVEKEKLVEEKPKKREAAMPAYPRNGPPIKDVWVPPAKPVVGKPPARPEIPYAGNGDALSVDHPAYRVIKNGSDALRQVTRRNREVSARLVGHRKFWPEESIFISIASYRDPECAKTVSRAFERAAHPDRVNFGIYQQNAEADVDCVGGLADLISCPDHAACGRLDQIRAYRVNWTETLGPTIARHMSERLYRDETYVMSFDSHTNFALGWDTIAIDMFKRIGNPRAIITTYPASYSATNTSERWEDVDSSGKGPCLPCRKRDDQRYTPFDPLPDNQMSICRTRRVEVGRTLSFKHDVNRMKRPSKPVLVCFLAAGFNFASGSRIKEVPYDKHSYFLFDGEETSLAVRAWTWGYDFYHPDRDIVSHLYIPNKSPLRPVFWTTDWARRSRIQFWTMLRINYLLGLHQLIDYWVKDTSLLDLREVDTYGLGHRRRVQDYWHFAGVSPHRFGPEWSKSKCKIFEQTGLGEPLPVVDDIDTLINDYSRYAESFQYGEAPPPPPPPPPPGT